MVNKSKFALPPERKLMLSVTFGWSLIIGTLLSSWLASGQFKLSFLIFSLIILGIRYMLIRPFDGASKAFFGWGGLALFDMLFRTRFSGGFVGLIIFLAIGILFAVIKGMFLAVYYLFKETYACMKTNPFRTNEVNSRPLGAEKNSASTKSVFKNKTPNLNLSAPNRKNNFL